MLRNSKNDILFSDFDGSLEVDDVTLLKRYAKTATSQQKQVAPARKPQRRPLVDVVNPQPKAFFAYLRMPKPEQNKAKQHPLKRRRPVNKKVQ